MSRLPQSFVLVALLAAALLGAAPAGAAATPVPSGVTHPPAGGLTAVPGAVVAAVNALSSQASPCALMTRELRESVAVRVLLARERVAVEPFGADDVTRLCDAYLLADVGFGTGTFPDRGGWLRTELSGVRIVRERDGLVQLRARVAQRYRPQDSVHESDEVVNLYVAHEDGAWRLASLSGLLEVSLAHGRGADSPRAFASERAERVALTRRLLRGHARMVREQTTMPRPLLRRLPSCGTGPRARVSSRHERPGYRRSGVHLIGAETVLRPVGDPRAARVDAVRARLSSGRGRLCWTVGMHGPVAERVDVELLLGQDDGSDGRVADWVLRIEDGRAVGLINRSYGLQRAFPVRAGVHGHELRVVVPAARVRGPVRIGTGFGWSLMTRTAAPDRAPASTDQWVDSLPALNTWDDLAGIRHGPRAPARDRQRTRGRG